MNTSSNEIAVVITSQNQSLNFTVSLTDRKALKKLKERVDTILKDAIENASDDAANPVA